MESLNPYHRYDQAALTFVWTDTKEVIKIGQKAREIVFLECRERPDQAFVQLPPENYGSAIMLWDDLRRRTLDANADTVRSGDRSVKPGTITFDHWVDLDPTSRPWRASSEIFKPTPKIGSLDTYAAAWDKALSDTATHSITQYNNRIAKIGNWDVKNRYFSPAAKSSYKLLFVPEVEWLTEERLKALVDETIHESANPQALGFDCVIARLYAGPLKEQAEGVAALTEKDLDDWSHLVGWMSEAGKFLQLVKKSGLLKIGMHPLGLYSTWIPVTQLRFLIREMTGTDYWIRTELPEPVGVKVFNEKLVNNGVLGRDRVTPPAPTLLPLKPGQATLAEKRRPTDSFMGSSANNWATKTLQWADSVTMSCYPAEWLHREAHNLDQKVADRFSNIIFGTNECNTHMMRAEATIRALLNNPDKVDEVQLETTAVDDHVSMVIGVDGQGKLITKDWNYRPWKPQTGPDYWWITLQLKYTIRYQPKYNNNYLESTTYFKPFSRYRPFRFEVDLDAKVTKDYFEQQPFKGKQETTWHSTLNKDYLDPHVHSEGTASDAGTTPVKIDYSERSDHPSDNKSLGPWDNAGTKTRPKDGGSSPSGQSLFKGSK